MNTVKSLTRAALVLAASSLAIFSSTTVATAAAISAERVAIVTTTTAPTPEQSRDGQNRRVRIHNTTGWTMLRFYASNVRTSDWEEDILGDDVLANSASIMMNIDDGSGACLFDFKAEFTNGQTLIRNNINVCEIADYYYTR